MQFLCLIKPQDIQVLRKLLFSFTAPKTSVCTFIVLNLEKNILTASLIQPFCNMTRRLSENFTHLKCVFTICINDCIISVHLYENIGQTVGKLFLWRIARALDWTLAGHTWTEGEEKNSNYLFELENVLNKKQFVVSVEW